MNISIVSNQQKFRETYMKIMRDYLKKYYTNENVRAKESGTSKMLMNDEDSDDENEAEAYDGKQIESEIERIKDCLILKGFNEYREDNYHKSGEEQKYYYYKQWLWLQFPWIGQSINSDYSKLIQECITSPTQYMSI